jgi:hypothetical protein
MTDLTKIPGIDKNMAQGAQVDRCALYCYRLACYFADRDALIADCELAKETVGDCSAIEQEIATLQAEIAEVTELSQRAIYENAHKAVDQDEWQARNNAYLERYDRATARVAELEKECEAKQNRQKVIEFFIRDIKRRPLAKPEFDEELWHSVIENVTIGEDGGFTFRFKNGSEVEVK